MSLSLGVSAVFVLALELECSPRLLQPEHDCPTRGMNGGDLAGARRMRSGGRLSLRLAPAGRSAQICAPAPRSAGERVLAHADVRTS